MEKTIEQKFREEMAKEFKELKDQSLTYISSHVAEREDYAANVGMIRAVETLEDRFNLVCKQFFNTQ